MLITRFLHWLTGGSNTAPGLIHLLVIIDADGDYALTDTTGEDVTDPTVNEAFDKYWDEAETVPEEQGTYPITYNAEDGSFSGFNLGHKRYRLIHTSGQAPRLINDETGEDETDEGVLAALATTLTNINLSSLESGEYHLDYNPESAEFHGFGGGDSGGGGASSDWKEDAGSAAAPPEDPAEKGDGAAAIVSEEAASGDKVDSGVTAQPEGEAEQTEEAVTGEEQQPEEGTESDDEPAQAETTSEEAAGGSDDAGGTDSPDATSDSSDGE